MIDIKDKLKAFQSVFDPLYGYIPLSEAEFRIVRSPLFQRLGQIRQLGFAHILFPSATHTRLSHSLGVLHVTQRMIDRVNSREHTDKRLTPREQALLRFAALTHDIGHLPLSHVGERAYVAALRNQKTAVAPGDIVSESKKQEVKFEEEDFHEQISASVVEKDREIAEAIEGIYNQGIDSEHKLTPKHVADLLRKRVKREKYGHLVPFIKSGLDADRLDFLMRDSYFVGSNYGRIEQETLIRKLSLVAIDAENDIYELCLEDDAALVADHFLLSRFYWYSIILALPRFQFVDLLTKSVMEYLMSAGHIPDISRLHQITENLNDENARHEFIKLQDSQVIMAMRSLHEKWQNNPPLDPLDQEVNVAIKVLMGGNLSHKFCHRQGLMEKTEYKSIFNDSNLEQAEAAALQDIKKKITGFGGFVKVVCKATDIHKALSVRDPNKGSEFHEDWHEEVLIRCDKDGFPPCLPLQLSDTNLSYRLGSSRPREQRERIDKENAALTHVNFAVFALWPGSLSQSDHDAIDVVIAEHFGNFAKPLEDTIHGNAGPVAQTGS
jgi:HD superfamily phosphohydrolase